LPLIGERRRSRVLTELYDAIGTGLGIWVRATYKFLSDICAHRDIIGRHFDSTIVIDNKDRGINSAYPVVRAERTLRQSSLEC
jgi:hypothetical protein